MTHEARPVLQRYQPALEQINTALIALRAARQALPDEEAARIRIALGDCSTDLVMAQREVVSRIAREERAATN